MPARVLETESTLERAAKDVPLTGLHPEPNKAKPQFIHRNITIAAGTEHTMEIDHEPERWVIYCPDTSQTANMLCEFGSFTSADSIPIKSHNPFVLPGRGKMLTIKNADSASITLSVAAVTGLPYMLPDHTYIYSKAW